MKWRITFLLCFIVSQALACQKTPTNPPQQVDSQSPQPMWALPRDGGAGVYGWFPQFIYKNTLVTYTKRQGITHIIAVNKDSGNETWSWNDIFSPDEEATIRNIHIYDNIMVWRVTGRVYAININTGQTVWKQRLITNLGFGTDEITGLGNRFLFHSARSTHFSGYTRYGNITDGPILMPAGNPNRIISSAPQMFLNSPPTLVPQASQFDTLAILAYTTAEGEGANVFNLYNLTQEKYIYTKTILGDTSGAFSYPLSIHNGKIYSPSGPVILCFDIKTGNELWRTRFSSITTSALLIVNNKIYSTNENGNTYCLDPENGKILWQTRTRGGASKPFYMNGVIYFTSIADGHLYGLDAEDGKILMKIDDPRGGIGFGDMVAGADGKIYANTYTHLYCFQAAR